MCDYKESLIAYLYDEIDAAGRRDFERHLGTCAECRDELSGLGATRRVLTTWAPPEPDFGFRIVTGASAPPPAPRRWFQPAWGLAAAAVLVLAAAAAIANVEIRYGRDGFAVRTGWARAAAPAPSPAPTRAVPVLTPTDWKTDYVMLDRRLKDLETALARGATPNLQAVSARSSDAEILRRVRELLSLSESRQRQEVARGMTTLAREVDRQRRVDLAVMRQGLEGASGAAAARDNQMMNYMLRVAQQK